MKNTAKVNYEVPTLQYGIFGGTSYVQKQVIAYKSEVSTNQGKCLHFLYIIFP